MLIRISQGGHSQLQHQDFFFDYERPWKRAETLANGRTRCCDRKGCFEVSFLACPPVLCERRHKPFAPENDDRRSSLPPYVRKRQIQQRAFEDEHSSHRSNSHFNLQPPILPIPIRYCSATRKPQNLRPVAHETQSISGFLQFEKEYMNWKVRCKVWNCNRLQQKYYMEVCSTGKLRTGRSSEQSIYPPQHCI